MHFVNNLLKRINEEGFVFAEYDPSLIEHLDNDVRRSYALRYIIEDYLEVKGENIYCDWEVLKKGEEIPLHYHIIPGSFQAVTWIPEGEFEGREFLYGTLDDIKKIKPRLGLICFFKPNDPKFVHGVAPLLTDTTVYSYGFTSSTKDIWDTDNDIYI